MKRRSHGASLLGLVAPAILVCAIAAMSARAAQGRGRSRRAARPGARMLGARHGDLFAALPGEAGKRAEVTCVLH